MPKIDAFLKEMNDRKASDLHLSVGFPAMLRLKGDIVAIPGAAEFTDAALRELLFEIMTEEQRSKFVETWDLDFAYQIENLARFRANVFMDHRGIGGVFRIIPSEVLGLETLGLPEIVTKLAESGRGLILVTGPTGSGKSTTLASMINHINTNIGGHIITIEDPIEFVHPVRKALITQREVHAHTRNFSRALRAACREDPDVILVGEMRDPETIGLAITAAELGILVFGTLHTNGAAKTVDRIIDAFPAEDQPQIRTMLADSLKGVISQQLLRTKDGKGRVAAIEVLVGGPALASLVRDAKVAQISSMIQTRGSDGMISMDKYLQNLVQKGKITVQEALSKAHDKKLFSGTAAEGGEAK